MKRRICAGLALPALIWIALGTQAAFGQKQYHGADSVFRAEGIAVFWAILKGVDEVNSQVYIKIVATTSGAESSRLFSILAVDPFSDTRDWLANGEKFNKVNFIKSSRASFQDKPARRMLFFRNRDNWKKGEADVVIYYMSIPDTAPEVLTEKQLEDYFTTAAARLD